MDAHWLVAALVHPVTLVAAGSAAGGVARYLTGRWVAEQGWAGDWPAGTFLINVAGSFLLGLLAAACHDLNTNPAHKRLYLLAGTGLCGGFTTFSTFSLEAHRLVTDGRLAAAGLYILGSVLCGLVGVALGLLAGRWLVDACS